MINSKIIKKLFPCFSFLVLFALFSLAVTVAAETNKSCLWEIKTDRNSVYLLGSLHLMKKEAYPLSRAIENAYDNSEIIVFETDLDAMNDPAFQLKMMSAGMYPDGNTLSKNLPEKTYLLLKERLKELNLPVESFDSFKPWFCATVISIAELKKRGFDPAFGIDNYFFSKAKQDTKKRLFFETGEFQLNLFTAMEELNQTLFLEQTLKDIEIIETMFPEMVKYWENGDAKNLALIINKSLMEYPAIYERFIIKRNNNWLSRIESFTEKGEDVLIIVGTGHLVGGEGIVELLKNKGYKLKQH
jgi:uncharacterized protein YbaP (TraB family)